MSLATAPDGQFAVFSPHSCCRVRLYIALVYCSSAEISFNDDIGFFKTFIYITKFKEEVVSYVRALYSVIFI